MFLQTGSANFWIVLLAAASILVALAYVAILKYRIRRGKRHIAAVSATIIDYFRRSGVDVSVGSVSLSGDKRFTAFIESEPMKRFREAGHGRAPRLHTNFRLSHQGVALNTGEATLREHVLRFCGLELDKVYWRFPIKETARNPAVTEDALKPGKRPEDTDEYINEGLVHYKHLPKVEVTELSWENFEEVNTIASEKKATTGEA